MYHWLTRWGLGKFIRKPTWFLWGRSYDKSGIVVMWVIKWIGGLGAAYFGWISLRGT